MQTVGRSQNRIRGFQSPELDFQLLRVLGVATSGGSSIGETMYVVNAISEQNPRDWVAGFTEMGRRAETLGDAAANRNHPVTARDFYFRASTYYRSAEYYADASTESGEIGRKSRGAFVKAIRSAAVPAEPVQIPYEEKWMPGYFLRPDHSGRQRKTAVMISGSDGTSEEIALAYGFGAVERGYNVLVLDGPGQMGMYRFHPEKTFRPDYEVPLGQAISYVVGRPEVDSQKLALLGFSFGGYFVARTAAHDDRVRAVIPDSPLTDVGPVLAAVLGDLAHKVGRDILVEDIDALPESVISAYGKPTLKSHVLRFGARSTRAFLAEAEKYKLDEATLRRIECPTLALSSAGEGEMFRTQWEFYLRSVSGPVTRYEFSASEGADAHCQMGNPAMYCAVAFDWLDELFG